MTLAKHLQAAERAYWRQALDDCGGSVAAAARRAGVNRQSAWRALKRLGITPAAPSRPSNLPSRITPAFMRFMGARPTC